MLTGHGAHTLHVCMPYPKGTLKSPLYGGPTGLQLGDLVG